MEPADCFIVLTPDNLGQTHLRHIWRQAICLLWIDPPSRSTSEIAILRQLRAANSGVVSCGAATFLIARPESRKPLPPDARGGRVEP